MQLSWNVLAPDIECQRLGSCGERLAICHFAAAVTYETRGRDRGTPFHICKNYIRRRTPLSKIYAVPLIFRALTRSTHCPFRHRIDQGERLMLDVILLALGLGFFAFLVLYGIASEKL
jgi:hypothetical protein